jgi:hypothetical protein
MQLIYTFLEFILTVGRTFTRKIDRDDETPTGNFSEVFLSWTRIMSLLIV